MDRNHALREAYDDMDDWLSSLESHGMKPTLQGMLKMFETLREAAALDYVNQEIADPSEQSLQG